MLVASLKQHIVLVIFYSYLLFLYYIILKWYIEAYVGKNS